MLESFKRSENLGVSGPTMKFDVEQQKYKLIYMGPKDHVIGEL